jgi:ubiquinone/menaquinone biosynthesis C-methylase UbiE
MADIGFRRDLFQGTAEYYDRFRVPYPDGLIHDLTVRTMADGHGRLLDLASGTGQISFALHDQFAEVLAVDQEPEMVAFARRKAAAAGIGNIRLLACAAEHLARPDGSFDLVAIGNAFHRLPRDVVAANALRWLRPGGHLALLWGGSPWAGQAPWQAAVAAVMARWRPRTGWADPVPGGYESDRNARPDSGVLREAGFELDGRYRFLIDREWTPEEVTGFIYSTSVLSRAALGQLADAFAADLRRELLTCEPSGKLPVTMDFAYDLARRPA